MTSLLGAAFLATAARRMRAIARWKEDPASAQERQLLRLARRAQHTRFGREHDFAGIQSPADYQARVPLRRYEDFLPYIDEMFAGAPDVLWPGHVHRFALTSGTTGAPGANKRIPLSGEGVSANERAGRDVLNFYLTETRDTALFGGKFLYLGGSTHMHRHEHGLSSGDLSGIMTAELPWYVRRLRLPSPEVAALSDWERKLEAVAQEAWNADVRAVGGTPSWLVGLFERILALNRQAGRSAENLSQVWPHFSLLVHGGVNFAPYRATFDTLFGRSPATLEVYPASEGFVGVQDALGRDDMLLMLDTGMFYEFVPLEELDSARPRRCTVADVETGVNYAVILSTCSGLWGYVLGDTVRFTSLRPHRIRVTGRTKQFLSAFGEHLMVEDVEAAIAAACQATGAEIDDYHVAPLFAQGVADRPTHQWLVEFIRPPRDLERFRETLDAVLRERNEDYASHRLAMRAPELVALPERTFYATMKTLGKFGAQNKAPRLQNDRDFAEALLRAAEGG